MWIIFSNRCYDHINKHQDWHFYHILRFCSFMYSPTAEFSGERVEEVDKGKWSIEKPILSLYFYAWNKPYRQFSYNLTESHEFFDSSGIDKSHFRPLIVCVPIRDCAIYQQMIVVPSPASIWDYPCLDQLTSIMGLVYEAGPDSQREFFPSAKNRIPPVHVTPFPRTIARIVWLSVYPIFAFLKKNICTFLVWPWNETIIRVDR